MTHRPVRGALCIRWRDGSTTPADALAVALAQLADALEALEPSAVPPALEALETAALAVTQRAEAYGVVEVGPGVAWARRLLAELRDDGVKPSTLRDLAAALPVSGAAVLTKAHREADGDGLTAGTVAELAALALGGEP